MNKQEIIDALVSIAEATASLEHDNGATAEIQNLIAAIEADVPERSDSFHGTNTTGADPVA